MVGSVMSERKLVLFFATSLDGYMATKEDFWIGSILWKVKGDNGYTEFYETVDTVLVGKRTYDWIMDHAEDVPYQNKACYVFTRTDEKKYGTCTVCPWGYCILYQSAETARGKSMWIVGGGELLSAFMKEQLVDELILTLAPVLHGSGIPLFKEGEYQASLNLKQTRTFNQFVELHYEVKKS